MSIFYCLVICLTIGLAWYWTNISMKENKRKNIAIANFNKFIKVNGYELLDNQTVKKG